MIFSTLHVCSEPPQKSRKNSNSIRAWTQEIEKITNFNENSNQMRNLAPDSDSASNSDTDYRFQIENPWQIRKIQNFMHRCMVACMRATRKIEKNKIPSKMLTIRQNQLRIRIQRQILVWIAVVKSKIGGKCGKFKFHARTHGCMHARGAKE